MSTPAAEKPGDRLRMTLKEHSAEFLNPIYELYKSETTSSGTLEL